MHVDRQHTVLPHDRDLRTGLRPRVLRGAAVCAFSLAFGLAGQSVAQADDPWDRSGGQSQGNWGDRGAAPAPAPAPAPAAAPAPAPAAAPAGDLTGKPTGTSTAYSAWAPHVRPVVAEVVAGFGVSTVYTRPGHSPTQQLAADFMVYSDGAKGNAVAQYVIDNAARMKVDYVIYKQRIFMIGGSGWKAMEDRGSPTANHMDHVHVSFNP
ncbi:Peptidoglycan-binding lysin domain protein (fragment) [Modestobacter italicus]|uniref:Peptidoglycan-binding lysin domain protein n=1 Tax=Modestobacter italicus (strain DSM 44449 / CECT 9708 / BC 501) TaxID=2732864 RepID=I4EV50_MODI5